jgi:hypothetical protein
MLLVQGKSLGRRQPLFADFSIPVPETQGEPLTLRELITLIVAQQVAEHEDRVRQRQFLRVLTEREVAEGAERGKIESGGSEIPPQPVDCDAAIETALQAFEDGLYLVALDGQTVDSLDMRPQLHSDSRIAFVRLTLLAGG